MSNYGAWVNNERPKTKKALGEALATNPDSVRFDDTTAFGPGAGLTCRADGLISSDVVVGPCPYTNRKWYANIRNGKVV